MFEYGKGPEETTRASSADRFPLHSKGNAIRRKGRYVTHHKPAPGKRKEIMSTVFNIFAIVAMAAVVLVLLRGLWNMMKGGDANTSNKLMQARVFLQFVALCLILLAVYFTRG
jgi:hypothetical protein